MGKKIRVNITVDEEIHKKAKDLGFNISKLCENAMKNAIKRMKGSNPSNNPKGFSVNAFSKRVEWGCPDLNRSHESPSLEA